MRYILACLLFIVAFGFFVNYSFAVKNEQFPEVSGGKISEALANTVPIRFLPSSPFYFLIWVKEGVARFFMPSASRKADFDSTLAEKRLKESYLLLQNGDIKNSSSALFRYSNRIKTMLLEYDKARSQNQDVQKVIDRTLDDLSWEEVFFSAIAQRNISTANYNFQSNFSGAIVAFEDTVNYLNTLRPGIRNRFKFSDINSNNSEMPAESMPSVPTEATSGPKPLRIIY